MKVHQPKKLKQQPAPATDDLAAVVSPGEPTYCFCNRVSFGEMIGCDNQNCQVRQVSLNPTFETLNPIFQSLQPRELS